MESNTIRMLTEVLEGLSRIESKLTESEAGRRRRDPSRLSGTPVEDITKKTFLDAGEAAVHACRPSINAFRKWATSRCVPPVRDGRRVLYRRKDIERALERGGQAARR